MSLIKKIKKQVEDFGLKFFYDHGAGLDDQMANVDIRDKEVVVFAFLLSATNLTDGKESGNIGLFFAMKTEFDFEALENDDLQENCKEKAVLFLRSVDKGNILTYGDVTVQRFYDNFSVNLTGVAINSVFSETVGVSECLIQSC